MGDYYVYEWFNVDTGEVFYVGKGTKGRYQTKKGRNTYFMNYINKHNCKSKIAYANLSEKEAYEKEIEVIARYRVIGQVKCNLSDGGENPPTLYGKDNPTSRRVVQLTLKGEFIRRWDCINDVERELKISGSGITSCCKNKYGCKSLGGFIWIYDSEYDPNKKYEYKPDDNSRAIVQFDANGDFVREWSNAVEINKALGFRRSGICGCCNGTYNACNGYIWRYKDDVGNKKHIRGKRNRFPVPVVQLDLQGNFITRYKHCSEAAKAVGMKSNSHVVACCNGKEQTAYGYKWLFEHEYKKQNKDYVSSLFVKEVV